MNKIAVHPLTPARWRDFVSVMGKNGACSGCWCAYWRIPYAKYVSGSGGVNKARYKKLVKQGKPTGLLAYVDGAPAAWAQLSPRADLPALNRSRLLYPIDDKRVWSISCFFVHRKFRGLGLSQILVREAARHAKRKGAKLLEAYPVKTRAKKSTTAIYTGVASTFAHTGFKQVAARAPHRPIMRKEL